MAGAAPSNVTVRWNNGVCHASAYSWCSVTLVEASVVKVTVELLRFRCDELWFSSSFIEIWGLTFSFLFYVLDHLSSAWELNVKSPPASAVPAEIQFYTNITSACLWPQNKENSQGVLRLKNAHYSCCNVTIINFLVDLLEEDFTANDLLLIWATLEWHHVFLILSFKLRWLVTAVFSTKSTFLWLH